MEWTKEQKQQYHEKNLKRRQVLVGKDKKLMDEGISDIQTLIEKTGCKSKTMVERVIHAVEIAEKRGKDIFGKFSTEIRKTEYESDLG